jgi:uncharacterized membrane protein YphA (DoxX/SURF4 family)
MSGGRVRRVVLAAIRIVLGVVFTFEGAQKLMDHDAFAVRFDRWGLPDPSLLVWVVGGIEVVCGVVLLLGLLTRAAALVLLLEMLVAVATAGRVDRGAQLVVPPLLALACMILVARGGGGWQLLDVLDPQERGRQAVGSRRR